MPENRLRIVTVLASSALLVFLIYRIGPAQLGHEMMRLGWGLLPVIAVGGIPLLMRTWAWRCTLPMEGRSVPFGRLFALRLASESIGQLGVLGTVAGDAFRVSLLDTNLESTAVIASVALDRAFFMLSASIVSVIGSFAALLFLRLPHGIAILTAVFAMASSTAILGVTVAIRKRVQFLSAAARFVACIPQFRPWIEKRLPSVQTIEQQLLDFFQHHRSDFRAALLLNLASHCAAVFEAWLVLRLLGVHIGTSGAVAVEALTKVVNSFGAFNPGNIGTYEGGNVLIGKLLGFGAMTAIAFAFARRGRSLFWAVIGAICLAFLSKKREIGSGADAAEIAGRTSPAVILADRLSLFGKRRTLPRVGELPVLLRAILGLRKAGFGRTFIATGSLLRTTIESELRRTGRLPQNVKCFEIDGNDGVLAGIVEELARSGASRVAFVAGDCTFNPALLRSLAEWPAESGGLALMTSENEVGAWLISIADARAFAGFAHGDEPLAVQLENWLSSEPPLAKLKAPENLSQPIRTEADRLAAERKLDSWLVKPTDGIFARFNRKISIPISRQLIRFPITPNMVSIFTLGVSLWSGILFALGGYIPMLAGALVGLIASILDGCDGEVARLKLQESAFGCWLETVCDYLYYVFMFAGMTIGLARSSGARAYLYLGGLLVFGAFLSFITTAMQRRRLAAANRPEELLKNWQKEAERRSSNPLLYLARHTEFVVRRCFLPWAILVFAALRIVPVAFVLAVLGANVVWPIALYSYYTFPAASARRATA